MTDLTPLYKRLTELLGRRVPECWDLVDRELDNDMKRTVAEYQQAIHTADDNPIPFGVILQPDLSQLLALIEAKGYNHVSGTGDDASSYFCFIQWRKVSILDTDACSPGGMPYYTSDGDAQVEAVLKAAIAVLEREAKDER